MRAASGTDPQRAALAIALAGAVALALAEPATIAYVDVPEGSCEVVYDHSPELAERCSLSGFDRHGGGLLLLAALAGATGVAVFRGAIRPAGAVLVVVGVAALGLALIGDLPVTRETGAIGDDFDGATARAGLGFYLQLTGGLLALVAGTLALLATRAR